MADIQDQVLVDFGAAVARAHPELRSSAEYGRYASRVRIASPWGSCFDGREGVVARIHDEGNVFVRLRDRGHLVSIPFGTSELQVLP